MENNNYLNRSDRMNERYKFWAQMPIPEAGVCPKREKAWELYCDARDGLADGTTTAAFIRRNCGTQIQPFSARRFA